MSTDSQEREIKQPKPRGFAAMSPEKQKELSRRGGEAAHRKGVAHRFHGADAREAGRKGGSRDPRQATRRARGLVARDVRAEGVTSFLRAPRTPAWTEAPRRAS